MARSDPVRGVRAGSPGRPSPGRARSRIDGEPGRRRRRSPTGRWLAPSRVPPFVNAEPVYDSLGRASSRRRWPNQTKVTVRGTPHPGEVTRGRRSAPPSPRSPAPAGSAAGPRPRAPPPKRSRTARAARARQRARQITHGGGPRGARGLRPASRRRSHARSPAASPRTVLAWAFAGGLPGTLRGSRPRPAPTPRWPRCA